MEALSHNFIYVEEKVKLKKLRNKHKRLHEKYWSNFTGPKIKSHIW
jgi:hypothetical protein